MEIIKLLNGLKFNVIRTIIDSLFDIDYSVIKGEIVSLYSYGELGKRIYNDIDILVSKENLSKVNSILMNNGAIQPNTRKEQRLFFSLFSHQMPPYIIIYNGIKVVIDINFDLFWGEYEGVRPNMATFLSDTIITDIYGIPVKTLTPIKNFLQLCLHCYKDMHSLYLLYSRKSINKLALQEIYWLIINHQHDITVEAVYKIAAEYQAISYIYVILKYLYELFNDSLLIPYIHAVQIPEGIRLLNCFGLCEKERKLWPLSLRERIESENLYATIEPILTTKDIANIQKNVIMFEA